jgi:N-acetylneuraminic acid mutarotase
MIGIRWIYFFVIAFLFSCNEDLRKWQPLKSSDGSSPTARHECGFIEVEGKFYLVGGRGIKPVDIYDPAKNLWKQGASPPLEIHHFQPVEYNGYIIVLGAMTGGYPHEVPLSNMLVYNPVQDQWFIGDTIPAERLRGSGGTAVYDDKIYWVGGIRNGHFGDHKDFFDVYDPATKSWDTLPSAPQARDHFQAVVHRDKMYLVGGRRTKAPYGVWSATISEVDIYDFKSNKWSSLNSDIPTPRAGAMNTIYNDQLIVAGGESAFKNYAHNNVEVLNLSTNQWEEIPGFSPGRHGTGIIIYNDKIYLCAGNYTKGAGAELNDILVYE